MQDIFGFQIFNREQKLIELSLEFLIMNIHNKIDTMKFFKYA